MMPCLTIQNQLYRFIILLFLPLAAYTQKNDTVYLRNGDRITGEMKRYENGCIVLSTDGMSTLNIEYEKIRTLYSMKYYEIVTKSGFSYYGMIRDSRQVGFIGILISNDTVQKAINEIVEITPIKHIFWKKFYGSVELGASYYKSTRVLQYYTNSTINYRARKDLFTLALSLLYSEDKSNDTSIFTRKNDISLDLNHFFQGRWWGGVGVKVQQNTELDLDYRYQAGLGAGYDFVRTNPIRFYAMGGLLVNREKPTDSITASTNFEGLMSMKFTWLQHRHPKINISTQISAFPSFTISNRWRLEYNISAKYEIVKDLFVSLSFYDDYDSKPAGGGPALNDWDIIFSVGYTF
jgi:hypothetical protein